MRPPRAPGGSGGARRALAAALGALAVTTASVSPLAAQRRGTVETDYFESRALGVRKHYLVYLPPSYASAPQRSFPVAYYLHGVAGSESDWIRLGRLDAVMDSLVAAGMPELIVVMPDGDAGFYTTWEPRYDRRACPARTDLREPAERFCVRQPRYDTYVAEELVRHIDLTFRTVPDAAHRGIAGLSMGGYGATALAAAHPDVWSAAASHSGTLSLLATAVDTLSGTVEYAASLAEWRSRIPALWGVLEPVFGADSAAWWERDPVRRLRELTASGRTRAPALYVDVGTADDLLLQNRAFRAEATRLGVPLTYREHAGSHDWAYWRTHVGESLAWLAGQIGR